MKKIINGKKYDTDTAKYVAGDSSTYPANDFHYWDEELYRKKTGEYFLYGKGGPMTSYAESSGSGWTWGSDIIPYTESEARKWAERHCTVDEYEEIFGEVEE